MLKHLVDARSEHRCLTNLNVIEDDRIPTLNDTAAPFEQIARARRRELFYVHGVSKTEQTRQFRTVRCEDRLVEIVQIFVQIAQ